MTSSHVDDDPGPRAPRSAAAAAGRHPDRGGRHRRAQRLAPVDDAEQAGGDGDARRHLEPNAFFDRFLHDVRSLLSVAHGFAGMLLQHGDALSPDRRRELLAIVNRSLDQLIEVASAVDVPGQLVHRLATSAPEEVDLAEAIRHVIDRLDPDARVRFQHDHGSAVLSVHAGLVEDALAALVANALGHTPSNARITVTLRSDADAAAIEVADDGPGVPEQLHESIFSVLDRGDAPRGRAGAGLGLALVRFVAQAHDGRAWVEDVAGGGAAFHLVLQAR